MNEDEAEYRRVFRRRGERSARLPLTLMVVYTKRIAGWGNVARTIGIFSV